MIYIAKLKLELDDQVFTDYKFLYDKYGEKLIEYITVQYKIDNPDLAEKLSAPDLNYIALLDVIKEIRADLQELIHDSLHAFTKQKLDECKDVTLDVLQAKLNDLAKLLN